MLTTPEDRLAVAPADRADLPFPSTVTAAGLAPARVATPAETPGKACVAAPAAAPETPAADQPQGCLYALSQPPLMLFLCVVGGLIGAGAAWDLLVL